MSASGTVATKDDIADLKTYLDQRLRELLKELSQPTTTRYMDLQQCATYIGRTTRAVEGLIRRKEIPHMRVGRRLQFDRHRIDRWLERHARRGALLDHPG